MRKSRGWVGFNPTGKIMARENGVCVKMIRARCWGIITV